MAVAAMAFTAFNGRNGFAVGKYAPDITLQALDSTSHNVQLSRFKGKYTLVNFWTSDDASSRLSDKEISMAMARSGKLNSTINRLSVNLDDDREMAEQIQRLGTGNGQIYVAANPRKLKRLAKYHEGVRSVLLDGNGEVIAVNPTIEELPR